MSVKDDPEFQAALAEIAARKLKKKNVTRFQARSLLIVLGEALLAEDASVREAIDSVRALVVESPEAWREAVDEEFSLAATEHVRSCEPRYLKMPQYDFEYTVGARHRLEARLRAAVEIDLPIDETLLEQIARADALLEPYLTQS
jgi:hypothetical protein